MDAHVFNQSGSFRYRRSSYLQLPVLVPQCGCWSNLGLANAVHSNAEDESNVDHSNSHFNSAGGPPILLALPFSLHLRSFYFRLHAGKFLPLLHVPTHRQWISVHTCQQCKLHAGKLYWGGAVEWIIWISHAVVWISKSDCRIDGQLSDQLLLFLDDCQKFQGRAEGVKIRAINDVV